MNLKNTIRQAVNSARARKWAAFAIVVCGLAALPLGAAFFARLVETRLGEELPAAAA